MVHYKLFIVYRFFRVAYGPLQTLASVGLAQVRPNHMIEIKFLIKVHLKPSFQ